MKYTTWKIFGIYCLVLFLMILCSSASAQSLCDEDICVVEFNAGWNEANGVDYLNKLTDCGIKRVNIDKGDWKTKYGIIVVPTIIVFNGEEVKRFQADLSFKLAATLKEVQDVIDETIMEAF